MKHDIDRLLTAALAPEETPDSDLNQEILKKAGENPNTGGKWFRFANHPTFVKNSFRSFTRPAFAKNSFRFVTHPAFAKTSFGSAAAMCAIILLLAVGGITSVAAVRHYLSLSDAAEEFDISDIFENEDAVAINETQTCGDYTITLLGMVSGKELTDYIDVPTDNSYIIVAIEHNANYEDGSNVANWENDIVVSPYIRGYDPLTYNYFALGGSSSCFMENDVMYEAVETANLECFADTGVYLGVTQYRYTERVQAFLFDDETGEITQNPDYDGLNALFELPLDESKADPEKADAIIQWAENQTAETYAEVYLSDIENEEMKMMLAYLETCSMTQEYLEEHAALLQRKTLTPDADHVIHFSYEADGEEHYIDREVRSLTQTAYTNGITDLFEVLDYEYDEVQESILIEAVSYNEDGTVTILIYHSK
ncbi:MAG: DUF4179 domain-containing protein [Lachnospiraceae bacterium]|nr:DUF4179 domain-containing protein [Lachnospiraceae bacterium]